MEAPVDAIVDAVKTLLAKYPDARFHVVRPFRATGKDTTSTETFEPTDTIFVVLIGGPKTDEEKAISDIMKKITDNPITT